jgi:nicotinamide mononucleotide transporter
METITQFLAGMTGTSTLEISAFFLGLANITLLMRRSIWNYPFGIAMVTAYFFIFQDAKLYSDMLLQPFFFGVQIYGWWYWLQGNMASDGHIDVRRLSRQHIVIYCLSAAVGILILGTLMDRLTDAALPYPDATTTVLSVIAQILLARRYLENWIVWIGVDVLAIGIYGVKELYPTMVLYVLFAGLATAGLLMWRRVYLQRDTVSV